MSRLEKVLLKSREGIKELFNGIPMPTYIWQFIDEDLILLDFNRAAEEFTQGNMANYLGIKAKDLYKDRPDIVEDLYTCLKEKKAIVREMDNEYQAVDERKYLSVKYGFIPPDLVLVLTEDITEKKELEENLKKSEYKQEEGIKELLCLYGISDLAIKPNITTYELIQGTLELIPPSMQFPELTCVEIQYGDKLFRTKKFKETSWKLSVSITINETNLLINVYYLKENKFLAEESRLIDDIILRLEIILGKKKAEEDLKLLNLELENRIKKRTEELKESEEKFRELFNNMSSGVAVYEAVENGRDFIFQDFNIAGQKIDDIKKDDLIGNSVLEMFPMVKEFGLFEVFQRVWNTGEPEYHPISQYKDERIMGWRENYVYKLPTGEIVAVYDDVTVKKQAEQILKETLETTKLMLESLPVGVFLIGYDKKIKSVNKVALKLLGIDSEEEILDQYCYNYVCVSEKNICPIIDLNKNIDDSERCIINKAGNRIPILKSVIPIKLGSDNLLLEAFLDITPLKEIQLKLEESEKQARKSYKEANFYKDLFAHDINNILNGIKGASELYLLYDNDSTKLKEKHSLINIIRDQVIKGALLVSNVQKLSQLEDGKDVRLKEINVREIMNKAKKYTQESFQERTINIDEYYSIKKPLVLSNELLLDVFENLLNNAVKYNDSPIVKIQTKISRIIEKGKNYFKIEFIDNGIGVMDEKKEIIFKKGYMKEKGTKGMGFGLTLVKKLIKSYNGKIWVEDIVEGDYTQGSNFVILIPEAK